MNKKLSALLSQVPARPSHNPVAKAMELSKESPAVVAALKLFASMPPSTGVLANPVRHHQSVPCTGGSLELEIRSFTVRGKVFEDDIIAGTTDAIRLIFVGLFDRDPDKAEAQLLRRLIGDSFDAALEKPLPKLGEFMKAYPNASPDIAMQYMASLRKAEGRGGFVNSQRPADVLLEDLVQTHMENVAIAACASYMRHILATSRRAKAADLVRETRKFIRKVDTTDPFVKVFSLLLRRAANADESRIFGQLGAIQVHHGSAGSNMVSRYFATLHTRSVSDFFTASQMALDCARHFGAISDMTDFVHLLERTPAAKRDDAIRARILKGGLPTFGHPEIAAAGRENHLEMDPRPALYLSPLFDAIDSGAVQVSPKVAKRVAMVERIYQIALVDGVEKTPGQARLRLTPNTDFGAWLVQEVLGIEEHDRTLISYAYRGFGWMMDAREQLQQPIIRPVISPDPSLLSAESGHSVIPETIVKVHARLSAGGAFQKK